jgi:arginine exporter protein ArgO
LKAEKAAAAALFFVLDAFADSFHFFFFAALQGRFARWHVFKPKIRICVNFGGST